VPILVYDARRRVVEAIAGQGAAPRLATREHFAKKGIPGSGIEAAAVPATLGACLTLLDRYGTRTLADVAATLAILDRHEHDWHTALAKTQRRLIEAEKGSAGDRSRGLRLVADYFYRGPIARELDAWSRAKRGLLRYSDLATHVTRIEDPGPVLAADLAALARLRSERHGRQPARYHPRRRRGDEAGPGRSRCPLCRPALRRCAAGQPALPEIRPAPKGVDRPEEGVA
jgi:Gamma-glutamyltranspeptidase